MLYQPRCFWCIFSFIGNLITINNDNFEKKYPAYIYHDELGCKKENQTNKNTNF